MACLTGLSKVLWRTKKRLRSRFCSQWLLLFMSENGTTGTNTAAKSKNSESSFPRMLWRNQEASYEPGEGNLLHKVDMPRSTARGGKRFITHLVHGPLPLTLKEVCSDNFLSTKK